MNTISEASQKIIDIFSSGICTMPTGITLSEQEYDIINERFQAVVKYAVHYGFKKRD